MKSRYGTEMQTATQLDIAQLISQTVPLVRQGRTLRGPCPFRELEAECLEIDPATNSFYCPDCHSEGDAIDWLMLTERMSRDEAESFLQQQLAGSVAGTA